MTYTAYKFLLQPTIEQEEILNQWAGSCRWIWNWCLDENKKQYSKDKTFIFRFDLKKQLPKLKQTNTWLKDVPAHALQNRVLDFDSALKRVWQLGFGFPKYKSKYIENHNTFRIDQVNNHIKVRNKNITLPKIGKIKWVKHRSISGKLKTITVKKENNKWWCICVCDIGTFNPPTSVNEDGIIGIDLGIKEFLTTNDNTTVDSPKFLNKKLKKIKKLQRLLSRKKKNSNNRLKAKNKLRKVHYKIKCQRNDFLHKTSNAITKQYKIICVEDLDVKSMLKKHNLSRNIMDQGWYSFISQLQYKSLMNGGTTIKIDRYYPSSKTCSNCSNIQPMPLSIRTYNCQSCNFSIDRDLNAAINIRNKGINEIIRMGTIRICSNTNHACGNNKLDQVANWSNELLMKQEKI